MTEVQTDGRGLDGILGKQTPTSQGVSTPCSNLSWSSPRGVGAGKGCTSLCKVPTFLLSKRGLSRPRLDSVRLPRAPSELAGGTRPSLPRPGVLRSLFTSASTVSIRRSPHTVGEEGVGSHSDPQWVVTSSTWTTSSF